MNKIIAMWSHPRSMSTALERVMRERGDLECAHEPFMYYHYIGQGRGAFPGFDVQPDHPTSYEGVRDMLCTKATHGPVFFKDMAYYVVPEILEDQAFLEKVSHCFLIRNPMAAILSYHKLDPEFTSEECGLQAQWALFQAVEQAGLNAVVIEAETVRADTRGAMAALWRGLGLDYRSEAFDWSDDTPKDWEQVGAWHEEVSTSSGIRAADAEELVRKELEFEALAIQFPHLRDYLDHHQPFYNKLAAHAITP